MSLKEFARNLGLRSVAEVTPEKRYRMRLSTKLARAADSETDKENIVQPKRRKLWNNDKEHFTSITSRSSGIKLRNIPKPALNEDSSKDTTDSDTEFKRKVREQFARKSKQRASAAERDKETTSTIVTEKEQRTTRSSIRGPGPLKEQNKSTENKEGKAVQAASSEDVRRTRSSDRVRVPVRALKEQNKGSDSSDSPFVTSKKESSPKKAAKETERNAGKANLKKTKKGKVEEGKVDERVEKMKSAVVRSMTAQPVKIRASSVPPGREYTSLEDHAIVAWVSTGDRSGGSTGTRSGGNCRPTTSGSLARIVRGTPSATATSATCCPPWGAWRCPATGQPAAGRRRRRATKDRRAPAPQLHLRRARRAVRVRPRRATPARTNPGPETPG
ncbi:uncharacterized protein [Choristoneura fumiferana]|uniref:uncharacterized protein n=1 Tax=Choristoneura fumiferana TaxID=7141 RepID=UPI003D153C1F